MKKVALYTLESGDYFYHGGVHFQLKHKRQLFCTCIIQQHDDRIEDTYGVYISGDCLSSPINDKSIPIPASVGICRLASLVGCGVVAVVSRNRPYY